MKKKTLLLTFVVCAFALFNTNSAEATPSHKMKRGEIPKYEHIKRHNNTKHIKHQNHRHPMYNKRLNGKHYYTHYYPTPKRREHLICHNYDYDRVYIDLPGFHISF